MPRSPMERFASLSHSLVAAPLIVLVVHLAYCCCRCTVSASASTFASVSVACTLVPCHSKNASSPCTCVWQVLVEYTAPDSSYDEHDVASRYSRPQRHSFTCAHPRVYGCNSQLSHRVWHRVFSISVITLGVFYKVSPWPPKLHIELQVAHRFFFCIVVPRSQLVSSM